MRKLDSPAREHSGADHILFFAEARQAGHGGFDQRSQRQLRVVCNFIVAHACNWLDQSVLWFSPLSARRKRRI
jgi:hypothetical protein